jgi:hypothetical protein
MPVDLWFLNTNGVKGDLDDRWRKEEKEKRKMVRVDKKQFWYDSFRQRFQNIGDHI